MGRSRGARPVLLRPAEITITTLAWEVAAVALLVALAAAGLSYRLYPTTVLIIPGLTWAILEMLRKNWRGPGSGPRWRPSVPSACSPP